MVDGNVVPILVELAEADDAALECMDEEDVREGPMVSPVDGETTVLWPWMSMTEPFAKRTLPVMERSDSANALAEPVMWFIALVSRNHTSLRLSPSCVGVITAHSSLRKTWPPVCVGDPTIASAVVGVPPVCAGGSISVDTIAMARASRGFARLCTSSTHAIIRMGPSSPSAWRRFAAVAATSSCCLLRNSRVQ